MRTLIVNFKNYSEVLGEGAVALARAAEKRGKGAGVEIIVSPPTPFLGLVASKVRVQVYSQSVGLTIGEKSTGEVTPEAVKASGASGTLLNHSERRVPPESIEATIGRVKKSGLSLCLCAATAQEVGSLAKYAPRYLAVEPPELIGSGVSVSRAKPEVVKDSVKAARRSGFKGKILCGAGIVSGEDVRMATELGADGVLVSSSVVRAKDWNSKLEELTCSLI